MAIIRDIQTHIDAALRQVEAARVFGGDPILWQAFYDGFQRRFCWSSGSLEGNTLTLDETIAAIDYDEVQSGHSYSEYTEAKNLYKAIGLMRPEGQAITEDWIRAVQAAVLQSGGAYRSHELYIGTPIEAVYYPPKSERVPQLMREFIEAARGDAAIPRIAALHLRFERIHPFGDGNGRVGRIILCQMLMNAKLLPAAIEHKSEYRQAFRIFDRNGDNSPMVHLICKALEYSAKTLGDHAKKREQDHLEWE
ncbi:MAG: Fic family protein [Clostridiales bacterium]|nr:Fic family protein [Clostridiales bacterium]